MNEPQSRSSTRRTAERARRRILLVDDEADTRTFLRAALESEGYTCDEAGSGAAALAMLESFAPHVLIVDLGMPGMSGLEFGGKVRERLGRELRLIALTGHLDKKSRTASREAGFDYHLPKPVVPSELVPYIDGELWEE